MRPTDVLMNEHRVIEQVLDCLEKMVSQIRTAGTLDLDNARRAVDFFKNFADGCHHGKEENALFPMMESRGFPHEHGPIGCMLHEHDLGRRNLQALSHAIERVAAGDRAALRLFASHAQEYICLLREHILKEDNRLFQMANHIFTDENNRQVLELFARMETHVMGPGSHERYSQLANELADYYQVPRARPNGGGECSCSGHTAK